MNCKHCNKDLTNESYTEFYKKNKVDYRMCEPCMQNLRVKEYHDGGGEISTKLWMDATLMDCHHGDYGRLRPDVAEFYGKNETVLRKVFDDMEEVKTHMKAFETKHWLPWIQKYYNESDDRGHKCSLKECDVLLWGCAGRVLITVKDKYPKGNPKSKFGGAWISMIFDETSKEARGGIQGLCATKEEAIALLEAAMEMPKKSFKPDSEVTIAI